MLKGFKTYIGAAVAGLALFASTIGAPVPEENPEWVTAIVGFAGVVFAWYGRYDKERRRPE